MQRDKDHLARHGRSVRSREKTEHSREDSGRRGQEGNNEIKRLSSRTSDKYKKSGPGNEQSWPSRQREKSPLSSDRISYSHSRTASCSRVRGRSRSPRKPGQPGPGILKGRSATHDGRREVRWKMLRISRVDDVREFSPWQEEREGTSHSGAEETGHDDGQGEENGDEKVETRSEGHQFGPGGCKKVDVNEELTREVFDKEQVEKVAFDEEPVQKDVLNDGSVELLCSSKGGMKQNEKTKPGRFELKVVDEGNKSTKDCCSSYLARAAEEEIARLEDQLVVLDTNGNIIVEIEFADPNDDAPSEDAPNDEAPSEDSLEDSFHGYDTLVYKDRLLDGNNYEALIEEIESEATDPVASLLEVLLYDDYQSRPVQCRHTDCSTSSFPSTLGLLPLPQSGQQWHCSLHSHCLLCTDPPHSSTSVMCTMCARLYHTHHLDMDCVDKDLELFVCKLCSDPDQFTQTNREEDQAQVDGINQTLLQSNTTAKNSNKKVRVTNRMEPPSFTRLSGQIDKKKKGLLHEDLTLPQGWCRKVTTSGKKLRVIIIGPGGKRWWSRSDLRKSHGSEGEYNWDEFDFSLYGSKGQQ